ncbi:unannotated protein [freshwater metagenome]|uniref:Unannotated protein n=1 Tax=freshwater metagenome TaxID=449393 RepID=A0A6J7LHE4_9ZZZZ
MHVNHRIVKTLKRRFDQVCADDWLVTTSHKHFWSEFPNETIRCELWFNESVLVATNGVDVREMREQWTKEVADQRNLVIGKPNDQAIGRFTYCCEQVDTKTVDRE